MKRLLMLLFSIFSLNLIVYANNSCYIDQKEYESRYNIYENCLSWAGDNPGRCERDRIYAQSYLDKQKAHCEIQKVNQAGSYDDYICKGDQNCEKKYLLQQEYTKSLQNQKVRVDANVNYSGGVNVNHSGGVNYNHYFKY